MSAKFSLAKSRELLEVAELATPGPWSCDGHAIKGRATVKGREGYFAVSLSNRPSALQDAAAIASYPELVAQHRAALEVIEAMRSTLVKICEDADLMPDYAAEALSLTEDTK